MRNKVRMAAEKFVIKYEGWDLLFELMPFMLFAHEDEDGGIIIEVVKVLYKIGDLPDEELSRKEFEDFMVRSIVSYAHLVEKEPTFGFNCLSMAVNDDLNNALIRWHKNCEF